MRSLNRPCSHLKIGQATNDQIPQTWSLGAMIMHVCLKGNSSLHDGFSSGFPLASSSRLALPAASPGTRLQSTD